MTDRTINIIIKEDGSRVVKRNLEEMGEGAKGAGEAIELLKKSIEGIIAAEGIRAIVEMVNEYQELHNQLIGVTSSQANLNAVFDRLTQVAEETHSSIKTNVAEYQTLAQATHDLGLSQQQIIEFQTELNEATRLSTGSSEAAAQAVDQLAKSLATGRLEGGAFNRTLQQVPAVGDILARSLGVTRGQLKDMADQGDLSAKQLVDAFSKAAPKLKEDFDKLTPSIGEAFDELKQQLTLSVGAFNDSTGAGNLFAEAMKYVIEYLKEITPDIIAFGHALTGTLDPSTEMSVGMKVFASILVVVIGSLQVVASVIYGTVVGAFKTVGTVIGGITATIVDFAQGLIDEFTAIVQGIGAIPEALKQAAKGDFASAGKTLADAFSKPWDDAGKDFDRSAEDLKNTIVDAAGNIKDVFVDDFHKVAQSGEDMWTKLDKIWDEGSRNLQKKTDIGTVSTKSGPNVTTQYSAQEIQATTKALQQLLSQFDAVNGAAIQLSEGEKLLIKAQKEGIITKGQESQYLIELVQHYKDLLDPVGKYTRVIGEQTELLKLNADQRQIETEIYNTTQQWQQKGIKFTQDEVDTIRKKLEVQQQLNKVMQQQDQLLAGSAGKQAETFDNQLTAIGNLLKDKNSGFKKTDATNALAAQNPDLFANTQEQFDAQAAKFQTMYSQIDALRQKDLISEQTAAAMRVKVWAQSQQSQLGVANEFFGDLSQLSKSGNTKVAAVGKAAAIAQATINTYQAATAAYASLASIPYVGPELGAAAAAAAIVAGLANIAQIRNQPTGFLTGGSFTVPGATGGADSQLVAFRATPGEQVSIATPTQVRKGDPNAGGNAANVPVVQANNRIVNVLDPGIVGDYMATPDGETLVLNVMRRNSDTLKSIVNI
jgi:tape measure domain-containing protein